MWPAVRPGCRPERFYRNRVNRSRSPRVFVTGAAIIRQIMHPYHRLFRTVKSRHGFFRENVPFAKPIDSYFATAYINVSMGWATARFMYDGFATGL